jgi:hypothetical protein
MHELEDKIRTRAYEIWEREGRAGDAAAHWYVAEQEIHAALTSALEVDVPLPAKPKAQRRAKAAAAPDAAPKRKARTRTSAG